MTDTQLKRVKAGLCWKCGSARAKRSKARKRPLCSAHLRMDRLRKRNKLGAEPWKKGMQGRPPLLV